MFLFYVFFEATLIPVYFLVAGYGGPDRVRAAVKFLLFSLAGGLIMLAVGGRRSTSSPSKTEGGPTYLISELAADRLRHRRRSLDVPRLLHRLRDQGADVPGAHLAARTPPQSATPGTSVLLVSVLDKIGTFGMIRFCLELFPEASRWATPVVVVLAIFSILYGAFMAIGSQQHPAPDRLHARSATSASSCWASS